MDEKVREELAAAERSLEAGDYTESVRRSAELYAQLVSERPDLVVEPIVKDDLPLGGRGPLPGRGPWPDLLGVKIGFGEKGAEVAYDKDSFTQSEAITYYEYVLDTARRAEQSA
jgi:hypothetical protein